MIKPSPPDRPLEGSEGATLAGGWLSTAWALLVLAFFSRRSKASKPLLRANLAPGTDPVLLLICQRPVKSKENILWLGARPAGQDDTLHHNDSILNQVHKISHVHAHPCGAFFHLDAVTVFM